MQIIKLTGGWVIFYEFHNMYSSPNTSVVASWRIKWIGHAASIGEVRNAYHNFVQKISRQLTTEHSG
jgi:hypothetical protein